MAASLTLIYITLYCIVSDCVLLYCIVLYCVVLHCVTHPPVECAEKRGHNLEMTGLLMEPVAEVCTYDHAHTQHMHVMHEKSCSYRVRFQVNGLF